MSKWDRPPEPHDWRFFVGHLGRVLIATGLLLFGFVAYQLWGTGIETARAQDKLDGQFEQLIADQRADADGTPDAVEPDDAGDDDRPPVTNVVTDDGLVVDPANDDASFRALPIPSVRLDESGTEMPSTEYDEVVPAVEQNLPVVSDDVPLGQIVIADLGIDYKFVSGVTREALKKGVGYFRDTPLPGQLGNSALAGHRTTYGHPFGRLDEIAPGMDVVITLNNGATYTYVITGSVVVEPSDYYVISDSDPGKATLTLITCTPEHTSTHRLAVFAALDPLRSDAVGQATLPQLEEAAALLPFETAAVATTSPATVPSTVPATTDAPAPTVSPTTSAAETAVESTVPVTTGAPATTIAPALDEAETDLTAEGDAFAGGWFDDTAAWPHIAGWGAVLALIGIASYLLSRKTRHDSVGLLVGIVPFAVCLYFFYENLNRLLPPGL